MIVRYFKMLLEKFKEAKIVKNLLKTSFVLVVLSVIFLSATVWGDNQLYNQLKHP